MRFEKEKRMKSGQQKKEELLMEKYLNREYIECREFITFSRDFDLRLNNFNFGFYVASFITYISRLLGVLFILISYFDILQMISSSRCDRKPAIEHILWIVFLFDLLETAIVTSKHNCCLILDLGLVSSDALWI